MSFATQLHRQGGCCLCNHANRYTSSPPAGWLAGTCAPPALLAGRLTPAAPPAACSPVSRRPPADTGAVMRRRSATERRTASPLSAVVRLAPAALLGRSEAARLSCRTGLGGSAAAAWRASNCGASPTASSLPLSAPGERWPDDPTSSFRAASSRCSSGSRVPAGFVAAHSSPSLPRPPLLVASGAAAGAAPAPSSSAASPPPGVPAPLPVAAAAAAGSAAGSHAPHLARLPELPLCGRGSMTTPSATAAFWKRSDMVLAAPALAPAGGEADALPAAPVLGCAYSADAEDRTLAAQRKVVDAGYVALDRWCVDSCKRQSVKVLGGCCEAEVHSCCPAAAPS